MPDTLNNINYPLISVVVPVYNAESFLERTVQTIREQTYPNLEILLINDGSKDRSLEVCRELEALDERIRVYDKENGGASTARNVGIRNARGKYIGFVDSDDLILPDMYMLLWRGAELLEAQSGNAAGNKKTGTGSTGESKKAGTGSTGESKKAGRGTCGTDKENQSKSPADIAEGYIVQIGREEIDPEGNPLPAAVIAPKEREFVTGEKFAESLLLYTGDASFCTSLLPAEYMKKHLFPEGVMGEDFILLMRMSETISGVLRLPETGYRVVHRPGSATRRKNPSQFSRVYVDIVRHADEVEEEIAVRHPVLKEAALRFGLYERLDYLLHVPIADMNAENDFYQAVVKYLRVHFFQMLRSPYLTKKNKLYLTLLTAAPKQVRKLHWMLRKKAILARAGE